MPDFIGYFSYSRVCKKFQIENVTTAAIQGWLDHLKVAPRTLLNFRRAVSTLFEFARARGYVFENPVVATERPNTRNGDAVTIYTPTELAKLLSAAPADFLPAIVLCAFCGLRSAEAERLDWGDVDLKGGFFTIGAKKAKTRSRRLVPVSTNAKAWLMSRIRASKSWTERFALAQDCLPGTRFDWVISHVVDALRTSKHHPEPRAHYMLPNGQFDLAQMAKDDLSAFGIYLASAIETGNSRLFRDLADAIDAWHKLRIRISGKSGRPPKTRTKTGKKPPPNS